MKTLQKFLVGAFIIIGVFANAQTYKNSNENTDTYGFDNKPSEMVFLASQNSQSTTKSITPSGNNVLIAQIGADNNAVVDARSNSSEVKILQNGDANDIYYQVSAKTIEATLSQNGNNNGIFHTNAFNLENHDAQILQNGSNQNVQWFGGNSVSEKMKITMQGENQSIVVRNFN